MSSPGDDDQQDAIRNAYRTMWAEASDWELAQLDLLGSGAGQGDASVNDVLNSSSWLAWNRSPPAATSAPSRHAPPLPPSSAAAGFPLTYNREVPLNSTLYQAVAQPNLPSSLTPFALDSTSHIPSLNATPAANWPVSGVQSGNASHQLPAFQALPEQPPFDFLPEHLMPNLFDFGARTPPEPPSSISSPSPAARPSRTPNTVSITEYFARHMPSRTQSRAETSAVVDLTASSSSPPTSTSRRASTHAPAALNPTPATPQGTRGLKRQRPLTVDEEAELIDEAPSAEEELLQAQQQETIRAQQAADENGPQRIGKRQCIICMESYTNATVTSCGHFYCHECLTQALKAGEKHRENGSGMGSCPVCRKPLSRNNKKKRDIIPVVFMTKAGFEENKRKRMGMVG